MMEWIISLTVATLPVVALFTFVYLKDKHEREPLKYLIWSFVFGILIAVPAVFGELSLEAILGVSTGPNFLSTMIYAMIVVSAVEEGLKYLVLRFYMYPKAEFDEPYDGIMYAVAVSLGFAFIENVGYVADGGLTVGLLRMFTAVPGHTMFAVVMGYFVGQAKFQDSKSKALQLRLTGLVAAIVIHGLYDFFLMLETKYILVPLLAFVVLIVGIILARKAMKIHADNSPHQYNNAVDDYGSEPDQDGFS